jgi:hypothetical protein
MKENIFEYLDELRESGTVNMFGAGQYLQFEFDLTKHSSFNLKLK